MSWKWMFAEFLVFIFAATGLAQEKDENDMGPLLDAMTILEMKRLGDPEINAELKRMYNHWKNPDPAVMAELKGLAHLYEPGGTTRILLPFSWLHLQRPRLLASRHLTTFADCIQSAITRSTDLSRRRPVHVAHTRLPHDS